jgi:hypothetical protein
MISTDPPYYDNIGYADLSDFFYVWLRRSLRPVFPDLFATVAVPKSEELVATPYRHGGRAAAEAFFLEGMKQAMHRLSEQAHPGFPVAIYYAFKQSETKGDTGTASTGWEIFLDAVIRSGFAVGGTWPMRTELGNRMIGMGTNALASSVVLVCRPRPDDAPTATRREFVTSLRAELPLALVILQTGNVAPVDLAQAAIGPGMAIYTRYAWFAEIEATGTTTCAVLVLAGGSVAFEPLVVESQGPAVLGDDANDLIRGAFGKVGFNLERHPDARARETSQMGDDLLGNTARLQAGPSGPEGNAAMKALRTDTGFGNVWDGFVGRTAVPRLDRAWPRTWPRRFSLELTTGHIGFDQQSSRIGVVQGDRPSPAEAPVSRTGLVETVREADSIGIPRDEAYTVGDGAQDNFGTQNTREVEITCEILDDLLQGNVISATPQRHPVELHL